MADFSADNRQVSINVRRIMQYGLGFREEPIPGRIKTIASWIPTDPPTSPAKETTMDIKKNLQEQIDRASARLALYEKFGEDPYGVEAVVQFDRKFTNDEDGTVYSYAAIKATDNGWWITGRAGPHTWDQLVQILVDEGECTYFGLMNHSESIIP